MKRWQLVIVGIAALVLTGHIAVWHIYGWVLTACQQKQDAPAAQSTEPYQPLAQKGTPSDAAGDPYADPYATDPMAASGDTATAGDSSPASGAGEETLIAGNQAGMRQRFERGNCICRNDIFMLCAMDKLQALHQKLNIADAALAVFNIYYIWSGSMPYSNTPHMFYR